MPSDCQCEASASSDPPPHLAPAPRSLSRRLLALIQWAIPPVLLALIPKCPLCLAAHIALWTGLGLSIPAAYYLRLALLSLCILSLLCCLAAAHVHRRYFRPAHP